MNGGLDKSLLKAGNQEPYGLMGVNIYNTDSTDSRKFEYIIGVPSDIDTYDELTEYTVPSMTWAVFPCTRETIGKTEAQAISKWLPKSKYRPLNKDYIMGRMKRFVPFRKLPSASVWQTQMLVIQDAP